MKKILTLALWIALLGFTQGENLRGEYNERQLTDYPEESEKYTDRYLQDEDTTSSDLSPDDLELTESGDDDVDSDGDDDEMEPDYYWPRYHRYHYWHRPYWRRRHYWRRMHHRPYWRRRWYGGGW
mmetsp:Transcript_5775/g.8386  ORF Transcript_5775/g.8386 Transcript_5775/m.8386 type:complete len:125 (-) Transcript_5775:312-686(-)